MRGKDNLSMGATHADAGLGLPVVNAQCPGLQQQLQTMTRQDKMFLKATGAAAEAVPAANPTWSIQQLEHESLAASI